MNLLGTALDITENKMEEETLRESEEKYRSIFENAPVSIILLDRKGQVVDVNPYHISYIGKGKTTREDYVGKNALTHPSIVNAGLSEVYADVLKGKSFDLKEIFFPITTGGTASCFNVKGVPLLKKDGEIIGALTIHEDITEYKKTEKKLQVSEARFRSLIDDVLDNSIVGIFILDANFQIVWANKTLEQYFGFCRDEVIGKDKRQIIREKIKYIFEDQKTFTKRVLTTYDNNTYIEKFECHVLPGEQRKERWLLHQSMPIKSGLYAGGRIEHYHDITENRQAGESLKRQARIAMLGADIGSTLTMPDTLRMMLQKCTESLVNHLDAAFARIWTLDKEENMLELQASSGMYTHIDGPHCRVPVGSLKIGLIAQEQKPHLTNDVMNDPRISDREWARREGMVAFAGYPLIVEDRLVGVMAMFACQQLTKYTLDALASVSDEIALGIECKKTDDMLLKQKKILEQKNIALHEVLGRIEIEKEQIKNNVIANAENLLLPIIQKLRLKGESRKYVELLQKNIQELTSSFGKKLIERETRLTSREIEICNMIKNGLASKEIANLLNITHGTIERHRANIRNKLGIVNKDINLSSFLKTL